MNASLHIALVGALMLAWGCAPSVETTELTPPNTPEAAARPAAKKEMQLESRTDTVTTTGEIEIAARDSVQADSSGSFTIQIGAFKEPKNAARAQTLARERYHQQVFSDFNQRLDLYQIRIGVFGTYGEAAEFLQQIRREYPLDYKESWVATVRH